MICKRLDLCVTEELKGKVHERCDNNMEKCIESSDSRLNVKCEENNRSYILVNTQRHHVISYKIDGGVIVTDASVPKETNKCDYMFVIDDQNLTAILTELKGKHIHKALKQISNTLAIYKSFFGHLDKVYGRVVMTSAVPDLKASPSYVNLETILRKAYHGNLKIAERRYTEKDTDLDK